MRNILLSDDQIAALIAEPKPIPANFRAHLAPRYIPNNPHRQISRELIGSGGTKFGLYARINPDRDTDFSLGLRVILPGKPEIGLVRCNGWHGPHYNKLERGTACYLIPPDTFHVHKATERYLLVDRTPLAVGFAEQTSDFLDFDSALEYFVTTFGFVCEKSGNPFARSSRQHLLPGMDHDSP